MRNLPYETTHEELVELAAPFGSLVQSKLNVGPNRNQAFIEFPDQPTAIAMCNYFNGSADPAKVRPEQEMMGAEGFLRQERALVCARATQEEVQRESCGSWRADLGRMGSK